ncbi:MAG: cytochrome c-type biogenesis CcmF C-terminal domain-containing protein, partial [Beijerinckiaceae bacterium]
ALPLLLAMPFGQQLAWKRGDLGAIAQRLLVAIGVAVLLTLVVLALAGTKGVMAPLGIGLGLFVVAGSISEIVTRASRGGGGIGVILRKAFGLPVATWGAAIAHAGVGVFILGAAATAYETERIANIRPGEKLDLGSYELILVDAFRRDGPNYRDQVAVFDVRQGGVIVDRIEPAKRFYPARQMPTTEVARLTRGFGQVYVALGEGSQEGVVPVRAYWKPFVLFLWLGAVLMALGGALALTERRVRVGAPTPARARA